MEIILPPGTKYIITNHNNNEVKMKYQTESDYNISEDDANWVFRSLKTKINYLKQKEIDQTKYQEFDTKYRQELYKRFEPFIKKIMTFCD